jgi:hypothetical protein
MPRIKQYMPTANTNNNPVLLIRQRCRYSSILPHPRYCFTPPVIPGQSSVRNGTAGRLAPL